MTAVDERNADAAISVSLDWYELVHAGLVGVMRYVDAILKGRTDYHGGDGDSNWTTHCEGACGEKAAAKAIDRYYSGSVNTFRSGGDVGRLQVRTGSRHDYELIVRDSDKDDDLFLLVTGRAPTFRVVGFIRAKEAKRPEWRQNHGGRAAAYFVPQSALVPL